KDNEGYIIDLIDIASEVIINLASEYYQIIQEYYNNGNIKYLQLISKKFLNLILLQANILSYNDKKSTPKNN
ncbi:Alpha-N-acetylglucosaminidase, partial [Candidatus Arthromitus sp. SFB-1]